MRRIAVSPQNTNSFDRVELKEITLQNQKAVATESEIPMLYDDVRMMMTKAHAF